MNRLAPTTACSLPTLTDDVVGYTDTIGYILARGFPRSTGTVERGGLYPSLCLGAFVCVT